MEVRRKAVKIALNMVTSRNVQEVVLFLKKQLTKTLEQEYEKACVSIKSENCVRVDCSFRSFRTWNIGNF